LGPYADTHVPLRPAISSLDLQTFKVSEILLQPAGASEARAVTALPLQRGYADPQQVCHAYSCTFSVESSTHTFLSYNFN
jgi:hypothetical protein